MNEQNTEYAIIDDMNAGTSPLISDSRLYITSMEYSAPPNGALNMLPTPAAIPHITRSLRSLSLSLNLSARYDPMPAPIWVTGPSRPALPPVPIVIVEVSILTRGTRLRMTPRLLWYAPMTASVPSPFDSGANLYVTSPLSRPPIVGIISKSQRLKLAIGNESISGSPAGEGIWSPTIPDITCSVTIVMAK